MTKKWNNVLVLLSATILFTGIAAGQKADVSSRLAGSLNTASTFQYGESREALSEIDEIMKAAVESVEIAKRVEAQFIDFLESNATLAGKQFVCRKLSVIGTKASVPLLAKMLAVDETFDMALYALEKIPSAQVDKVLMKRIQRVRGKQKIGLISTLGIRGAVAAVDPLKTCVFDEDPGTAVAAIRALAQIGTDEASDALQDAYHKTSGHIRNEAMNGYLLCADRMASAGMVDKAESMYRNFIVPDAIRSTALAGWIRSQPERAGEILLDVLHGDDMQLKSTAIRLLGRSDGIDRPEAVAGLLPRLSGRHQVQLITALAERRDPVFMDVIVEAADHEDAEVRIAALKALAELGDASTVDLLVTRTLEAGPEQEAARESLYRIRGADVDKAIVSGIATADPEMTVELLAAIGNRHITSAARKVLDLTGDPEPRVRQSAIKTLGLLGQSDMLPDVIDVLVAAKTRNERREAVQTVVTLSRQLDDEAHQASFVLASLPKAESVESRSALLEALGRIGDTHALSEIRKSLYDRNAEIRKASIRALSEWPDAEPVDDLFDIAENSEDEILQPLALRGCIRLIGIDGEIETEEKVEWYGKAFQLASGIAEKRLVLSGLADLRSVKAMEMAGESLEDANLQQEAEAAVIGIAERIWRDGSQQVLPFLDRIYRSTNNEDHREDVRRLMDRIDEQEK